MSKKGRRKKYNKNQNLSFKQKPIKKNKYKQEALDCIATEVFGHKKCWTNNENIYS